MTGKILSASVRQELLHRHKHERDKRMADRLKAVLLRDDGWALEGIAEALFLSHEAVRQHLLDYECSGKLAPESGGSSAKLDEKKAAALLAHLEAHLYVKVASICDYVEKTHKISYSVRGMTDWLKRHGFSFHQPCGVPAKADSEAQAAFVKHYEAIQNSLMADDQILFMDGVHPSHAVRFVRGWIRKGVRKEIPTNAGQKRLNILGMLNLEKMTLESKEYATLNAEAVIAFFTYLLTIMPLGLIHIILDQGRYQKCAAVEAWNALNPRIRLHYLPAYSPNLNAIERVWKLMHEHTTDNEYHATFKAFTEKIRQFLNVTFQKNADDWMERLNDNFRVMQSPLKIA
jgi:transposase